MSVETGIFWYGDNLEVMRDDLTSDGDVDLIYLDPPFNSEAAYNMFFKEADASISQAQRTVFEDYWTWGPEAEAAYEQIQKPRRRMLVPATLAETMQMMRSVLRDDNMMAYLSMMTVRLIELRRLLKPTGSLYLHCDPTASHYLKIILDALFGPKNFRSEAIWKRMSAHSSARRYGPIHDTILFYTKSDQYTWNPTRHEVDSTKSRHDLYTLRDGTVVKTQDLTANGTRNGRSGVPWKGFDPNNNGRHWRTTVERLDALDATGKIYWSEDKGVWPRLITAVVSQGSPLQDVWNDIPPLNPGSREKVGYPTQKPVALLKRIIEASSNPGDVVLDPFCGCGTAVIAAQGLARKWIGIDVTHLAVSVLKRRMDRDFPGVTYRVRGEPADAASARDLAARKPLEFQAWIVDRVGGIPVGPEKERKVAKGGGDDNRDGFILFQDDPKGRSKRMLLSVKSGPSYVNKPEIVDSLGGGLTRHGAILGTLLMSHKPSDGTYRRAAGYKTWSSQILHPEKQYPVIQIVTVDDVFAPGWRGLLLPGENTSLKSQPPEGTPGASELLFDEAGIPIKKKAKTLRDSDRAGGEVVRLVAEGGRLTSPKLPSGTDSFRLVPPKKRPPKR